VYYVHSTIAVEAAGMSSWGVCITGLLRSLLHPLVHESYAERIVAPLARAGVTVATHIVVVGKWAALNHTQLEEAVRDTYTVESLQLLPPQSPRYRCRPSQLGARHVLLSHVLAQRVAAASLDPSQSAIATARALQQCVGSTQFPARRHAPRPATSLSTAAAPFWSGAKGKMVSAAVVACKAAVNASLGRRAPQRGGRVAKQCLRAERSVGRLPQTVFVLSDQHQVRWQTIL